MRPKSIKKATTIWITKVVGGAAAASVSSLFPTPYLLNHYLRAVGGFRISVQKVKNSSDRHDHRHPLLMFPSPLTILYSPTFSPLLLTMLHDATDELICYNQACRPSVATQARRHAFVHPFGPGMTAPTFERYSPSTHIGSGVGLRTNECKRTRAARLPQRPPIGGWRGRDPAQHQGPSSWGAPPRNFPRVWPLRLEMGTWDNRRLEGRLVLRSRR